MSASFEGKRSDSEIALYAYIYTLDSAAVTMAGNEGHEEGRCSGGILAGLKQRFGFAERREQVMASHSIVPWGVAPDVNICMLDTRLQDARCRHGRVRGCTPSSSQHQRRRSNK